MSQRQYVFEAPGALPRRSGGGQLPVRICDVMTTDLVTVEATATIDEIADAMLEHRVRSVPVVDIGERLVGIVSQADVVSREATSGLRPRRFGADARTEHQHHWRARADGITAGEIMTSDVVTCRPDEPVAVVARRMLRHGVAALPVVDGTLVGMVSRFDLLRIFDRPDDEIRERVAELLNDALWMPPDHAVHAVVVDGVVTLNGTVRYARDVPVVRSVVAQVPGVIEVVSRMQFREPDPAPPRRPKLVRP